MDGEREMDLVMITGLSGAGKTQASSAFEDMGYYCVDNMPPKLIPDFVAMMKTRGISEKLAVVTDIRSGEMFSDLADETERLKKEGFNCKVLFLEADNKVLSERYGKTGRLHPLIFECKTLENAISAERERLFGVRRVADYIIDSSGMKDRDLRERVREMFGGADKSKLEVQCVSFGYKFGIPRDASLVADVRMLPNPYYVSSLREKNGLEKDVYDYVITSRQAKDLLPGFVSLAETMINLAKTSDMTKIVIAVGCTGGHHRSVAAARYLGSYIEEKCDGVTVSIHHRDIDK